MTKNRVEKYAKILNSTNPQQLFKIGEQVRILKEKDLFEKGSKKYSRAVYTIDSKEGNSYLLKNSAGNVLKQRFKIGELKSVDIVEKAPLLQIEKPAPKPKEMKKQNKFTKRQKKEQLPGTKGITKDGEIILGRLLAKTPKRIRKAPQKLDK